LGEEGRKHIVTPLSHPQRKSTKRKKEKGKEGKIARVVWLRKTLQK